MPNWLQFPQSEIMPSSFTGKMDTARASTRTNICDPYALVPSARVSNLTSLNLAFWLSPRSANSSGQASTPALGSLSRVDGNSA